MRKSDNALRPANDREWQVIISPRAIRQLEDLPADITKDILGKIEWLRADCAEETEFLGETRFLSP